MSAPARALALDARRLLRRSEDPAARPPAWSDPTFTAEVDVVRGHLAPLRTRRALADSFGREGFHRVHDDLERLRDDAPVRLAYAIRWHELGRSAAVSRS